MKERNPGRIPHVLGIINQYWQTHPNETLLSILLNVTIVHGWNVNDLKELEDEDLYRMFKKQYAPKDAQQIEAKTG